MIQRMVSELGLFLVTFGAIILLFFWGLRLLGKELVKGESNLYLTFQDIFNGFNSKSQKDRFT